MDAKPNTQEMDELDILATLVEAYEEKYYKIDAPDPISAIKFRMEQENLQQKDLIPLFGDKSIVSKILKVYFSSPNKTSQVSHRRYFSWQVSLLYLV